MNSGTGAQRYRDRRADGTVDRAVALPLPAEENDEVAAQAEQFVGDRYGMRIDTRRKPDVGDFLVGQRTDDRPRGMVLDVKWTPLENGRLVTFVDARVKADIYVLVTGMPGSFRIAGWIWGFLHRKHDGNLGHGPRHVTSQSDLKQNTDLMMATMGHPPATLRP